MFRNYNQNWTVRYIIIGALFALFHFEQTKSSTVGGVDQVDVTPELVSAVSFSLSASFFFFLRSLPSVKTEAEGLAVPSLSDRRFCSRIAVSYRIDMTSLRVARSKIISNAIVLPSILNHSRSPGQPMLGMPAALFCKIQAMKGKRDRLSNHF